MCLLLDTETTGLKPPIEVIELAYVQLPLKGTEFPFKYKDCLNFALFDIKSKEELGIVHERFKPSGKIDPFASNIHGIYFKDLIHCRPSNELILPEGVRTFMGYNVNFDHRVLGKPNVNLICLMQIAKKLWKGEKDLVNFKLTELIKFLYPEQGKAWVENAHGAVVDVNLTYLVLLKVIEKLPKLSSLGELVKLTSQPKA